MANDFTDKKSTNKTIVISILVVVVLALIVLAVVFGQDFIEMGLRSHGMR